MSGWEHFNGAFDYTATPLGPIVCKIIIHTTSNKRKSWDQRGREGFSVGPALHHYQCIWAMDIKTKSLIITYIAEYLHAYLTQPHVTVEYIMTHAIHFLSADLKYVPTSICDSQLVAVEAVQTIFANCRTVEYLPPAYSKVLPHHNIVVTLQVFALLRYPAPTSKGDQFRYRVTTSKGAYQQQPLTITKKHSSSSQLQGWPGTHSHPHKITHCFSQSYAFPVNPAPK